ncbi:Holliday junction branch migration protein RuvA [Thermochromatium tepidum]|jgi:Holliday junction DNA helicase subunit RuvA|uniref:Holliday junction branch migration complex subunit RuvA n=1 Tax=Thermochromatium tepidum ATCC 43061 TaxID=316276 RepID=A0A6I6EF44_THETI|nr:Holliday junction branch migration protein RuvA [Thermochromatium tepidum]QGU31987.1 Holliday junction branch migration protein RuvA [Thermochromatium tepidum ATCC 43061]
MIGRLQGRILAKHPPQLLLDVNGVGYELEAPMSTFYELPAVGETATLLTHLAVREDAWTLYGFMRERDRALFRALIRVTGVGARMALAILSGMDAARFAQCVEQEDTTALMRLPGIGKKTAERLIIEMRDRLGTLMMAPGAALPSVIGQAASMPVTGTADQALADAIGALIALGYKPPDANRMARAVDDGSKTAEDIIRAALRSVNPG